MLTITNKELIESLDSIKRISELDVPVRTCLKLRKILRVVKVDADEYFKLLGELGEKHAKRDDKGALVPALDDKGAPLAGRCEIDPAKREEFSAALKDLLNADVKIDFDKIKPVDLGDTKLKTVDVLTLDWLIDEQEG